MEKDTLFILIHGHGCNHSTFFLPHLQKKLEDMGYQTSSEDYPDTETPNYDAWKATFMKQITELWHGQNIVLFGHSMGGYTFLRIFGECAGEDWAKKVIGVITVSAVTIPFLGNYYNAEIDWEGIMSSNVPVISLHSRCDLTVRAKHQAYQADKMSGYSKLQILMPDKEDDYWGHFQDEDVPPVDKVVSDFIASFGEAE